MRVPSIDLVRGFALLGILTMNVTLALPGASRLNPEISGGFTGTNFAVWLAGYFLFDEKMITIFSYVFGASIFMQCSQPDATWLTFLRRQAALLAIGLLHAYLVWEGDILCYYAVCGCLAYPFRNLSPKRLLLVAFLIWLPTPILSVVFSRFLVAPEMAEVGSAFSPDSAAVAKAIQENLSSTWWELVKRRAPQTLNSQLMVFPLSFAWSITSRMLFGIALFRFGILTAERSASFYARLAAASYVFGYPFVFAAAASLIRHHFHPVWLFGFGLWVNQWGSLFVALGHLCLLMAIYRAGLIQRLAAKLIAVGRTSMTNYLGQSLLLTSLFYGYGFGLFGKLDRTGLALVVAAIWVLHLTVSPIYLRYFRRGPAEWLYRALQGV